jgi:hypothetical protein
MRELRPNLVVVACWFVAAGCGASAPSTHESPPEVSGAPAIQASLGVEWTEALFPAQNVADARTDLYGEHVCVLFGGRVYGSNGEDVPTSVAAALWPLALIDRPPETLRWAFIGIGSGIELGVALTAAPEQVDLYEPKDRLLEESASLREVSRLRYEKGRPAHDRLRIFNRPPEGPAPRYDIVVHAVGMTVISEPHRLYDVERLEALRELLNPGGCLVLHLQLYEIQPAVLQTLLRTFAAAFPAVTVMVPEDLSSDALLIGSSEALTVDVNRVRQLRADPALRRFFDLAYVNRDTDLACRSLLVDHDEVRRYAGPGRVYSLATPMIPEDLPRRPPLPPPSEGGNDDRWDAAFAAFVRENHLDENLVATFYDPTWPYGEPCPAAPSCRFLRGLGTGDEEASNLGDVALSLVAHGRTEAAQRTLDVAAAAHGTHPRLARASEVLAALELAPDGLLEELSREVPGDGLRSTLGAVGDQIRSEQWEAARASVDALLRGATVTAEARPMVQLYGALAQCGGEGHTHSGVEAVEGLLSANDAYFANRPVIHRALGWCQMRWYDYRLAVTSMERYVDLRGAAAARHP